MNTGFSTSDVIKETLEESIKQTVNTLQVVGKMAGTADVANNEVTVTATPVTSNNQGIVNMSQDVVRVTYMLIKDGSHKITYENIYAGILPGEYNSLSDALVAAKENGIITVNPKTDAQKPETTTAFLYWIINQNYNQSIENNEIASLVLVYSDKDRPATGEYIQIQVVEIDEVILNIERVVPNISTEILDLGGKVTDKD
jgi:flagellin FlaB